MRRNTYNNWAKQGGGREELLIIRQTASVSGDFVNQAMGHKNACIEKLCSCYSVIVADATEEMEYRGIEGGKAGQFGNNDWGVKKSVRRNIWEALWLRSDTSKISFTWSYDGEHTMICSAIRFRLHSTWEVQCAHRSGDLKTFAIRWWPMMKTLLMVGNFNGRKLPKGTAMQDKGAQLEVDTKR